MNTTYKMKMAGQAHIWQDEHGIIHIEHFKNAYLTKEDLYAQRQAAMSLSNNNQELLLLLHTAKIKGMTPEARNYISSPEMASVSKAVASLVSNPLSKMITSFFLGLNKPPYPLKIFTNEQDGVKWLTTINKAA